MSEQQNSKLNALQQAMQAKAGKEIVVKAEDLQEEGRDWSKTFFEPETNKTYTVKFLMNLTPLDNIVHRMVYKHLPDPKRKGKNFHYSVKPNVRAEECKPLELFFELHELRKAGDVLAEQKIKKYLGKTNQGAALVQILEADDKNLIGQVRIMAFSTFGENATIAQLLDKKLNPTKSQIKAGIVREDIFALTPTSVMVLDVKEKIFDGVKGRSFTDSVWTAHKKGMHIFDENGNLVYEFKENDILPDGTFNPAAEQYFEKAIEILQNPDIDIYEHFAPKTLDMEMKEETRKYLKQTIEKVDIVIPIIREAKSIAEIENQLKGTATTQEAEVIGDTSKEDLLASSVPELAELEQNQQETAGQATTPQSEQPQSSVDDILNNVAEK